MLGVDTEESRAYRALVSMASAAPAELAAQLGTAESEAARILAVLEDRGLAARSVGDIARFVASPPATAFGAMLRQRQNELRLAELELSSLTELYRAASAGRGVAEVVDVIIGAPALRQQLELLQLGARTEVMAFVKPPVEIISARDNTAEDTAVARGVHYRVLLERAMLDDDGDIDSIWAAHNAGEELRVAESLPLKLLIVDREIAIVPLVSSPDVATTGALLVHRSGLLDALIALFEREWATATEVVTSADGFSGTGVDDLDVRILTLLLAGLTDQAVAGHLRTSLRTVQRRVRRLMDLARVQTRMQLGYQAARLGWFPETGHRRNERRTAAVASESPALAAPR
ncbi:transcriptional regulator TrmB [Micromonospora sp. R77]|uniref:helix-turn-helix domain-containing protein n=1 Tax=Micromonospora sp. R77 TaxID=2925836 RepID=UPI001F601867|nr:helix-turn-helix domain-containing protein [Micromonospora sp. R77]MCI4066306.1 transcriptional regulator TrmB [Micromonospora sp. R77]